MSKLYKCDRCGKVDEPPAAIEAEDTRFSVRILRDIDEPKAWQLCDECREAFIEWVRAERSPNQ